MTKKNILAATIAAFVITSVSAISATGAVNAASCAETDPAYCEETETLGPPICILENERIPQDAWDAIRSKFDWDNDGEMHVADAIKARKDGKDAISDAICRYIINDGYDKGISMTPSPFEPIANSIRDPYIDLLSFWRDEDGLAYFMFIDEGNATVHVCQNYVSKPEQGFIKLWDKDEDDKVTEKDAARIYLEGANGCCEDIAIAASTYAQSGTSEFSAYATNDGTTVENLKKEICGHTDIVCVDTDCIVLFDYNGTMKYIY